MDPEFVLWLLPEQTAIVRFLLESGRCAGCVARSLPKNGDRMFAANVATDSYRQLANRLGFYLHANLPIHSLCDCKVLGAALSGERASPPPPSAKFQSGLRSIGPGVSPSPPSHVNVTWSTLAGSRWRFPTRGFRGVAFASPVTGGGFLSSPSHPPLQEPLGLTEDRTAISKWPAERLPTD